MVDAPKLFGLFPTQRRTRRLAKRQGKSVKKNPEMGNTGWMDVDKAEVSRRIAVMSVWKDREIARWNRNNGGAR